MVVWSSETFGTAQRCVSFNPCVGEGAFHLQETSLSPPQWGLVALLLACDMLDKDFVSSWCPHSTGGLPKPTG